MELEKYYISFKLVLSHTFIDKLKFDKLEGFNFSIASIFINFQIIFRIQLLKNFTFKI